jgi:hypothetical protein
MTNYNIHYIKNRCRLNGLGVWEFNHKDKKFSLVSKNYKNITPSDTILPLKLGKQYAPSSLVKMCKAYPAIDSAKKMFNKNYNEILFKHGDDAKLLIDELVKLSKGLGFKDTNSSKFSEYNVKQLRSLLNRLIAVTNIEKFHYLKNIIPINDLLKTPMNELNNYSDELDNMDASDVNLSTENLARELARKRIARAVQNYEKSKE